jgi:predicted Zn-dependent protease
MPRPIARPYPVKPAQELYGEALLAAGRPAVAAAQFKASLTRTPGRPAALLGLARAQSKAGQPVEARATARAFLAMWHLADAGRPEIAEARALAR